MKIIKILGIVILGIGLLLGISFLDLFGSTKETTTIVVVDSPFAAELLDSINDFSSKNQYDSDKYANLYRSIENHTKAEAITKSDEEELKENLNIVFAKQLNKEILSTFKNGCNKSRLNELEKQMYKLRDLGYQDYITDAIAYYQDYDKIEFFIQRAKNFSRSSTFNLTTAKKWIDDAKRIKAEPIVANCSNLANELNHIPHRIEDKHYKFLKKKTEKLVNSSTTTVIDCDRMSGEIDDYVYSSIYPTSKSARKSKTSSLVHKIDEKFEEIENSNNGYLKKD